MSRFSTQMLALCLLMISPVLLSAFGGAADSIPDLFYQV